MRKPRNKSVNAPLEFNVDQDPWKIGEWSSFTYETGVNSELAPMFVKWCLTNPNKLVSEAFIAMRMIYNINEAIPPQNVDERFAKRWSPAEAAKYHGMDEEQLITRIAAVMNLWAEFIGKTNAEAAEKKEQEIKMDPPPPSQSEVDVGNDTEAQIQYIGQFGFIRSMVMIPGRDEDESKAEVAWLASRVGELEKIFQDPNAKSLVRQAVINEMLMRRIDVHMTRVNLLSREFWNYQESKQKMEDTYRKQWEQLREICPEIRAKEAKLNFAGVISEVIEAVRRYKAEGNNEMIDGMNTALELQVLCRQNQQTEGAIQYRPDVAICVADAMRFIWDPKYIPRFKHEHLAIYRAGFHKGVSDLCAQTGVKFPDLEGDGEYPPLYIPPPQPTAADVIDQDLEVVPPVEPVPIE